MPNQFIWQKEDIPVALMLEVQFNNVPVSGISPTVEIYKYQNHKYIDFNTNTFVSAGGNKFGSMSGVPSNAGLYERIFNPNNFGASGNQIYYMRYRAVIPSGFQGLTENLEIIGSEMHYFTQVGPEIGLSVSFDG